MMETKRRREQRSMLPVHPDAAAIDIGATVHVAAVGPARDPEPVRSFGTFTGDLHRLADWFAQCGIKTVVMESTGVYWIPDLRNSRVRTSRLRVSRESKSRE
jgi:transposase